MLLQDLLNRCGWNNKHLQDDIRYQRYGYILFILSIVDGIISINKIMLDIINMDTDLINQFVWNNQIL